MTDKATLMTTRDYKKDTDHNFIMATWLRGLYYGDSWFSLIPKDIFMDNYHKVLEHVTSSPNTSIKIACLKDDPEVILGYSVLGFDNEVLHWVFCKSAWRSIGVARSLMPKTINTVSHLTKAGQSLLKKHPEWVFNPFAL